MEIRDEKMEPFFIKATVRSYDVYRDLNKVDNNGNPIYDNEGYYSELRSALKKVVQIKMAEGEDQSSLREYIEEFNQLLNNFINTIKL